MGVAAGFRRIRALFARLSLRTNLALLLLFAVAILAVDRAHELTGIRAHEIDEATAELTGLARTGAERQADVIASAKALLRLAVDLPITSAETGSGCQRSFRSIVDDLPWLRSLWVVAPDGRAICTNSDQPVAITVGDRPAFKKVLATHDFVLSDYVVGRLSGRPGLVASLPRMNDGAVETVVSAMIEVDWLSRIAREIGSSHAADVLLLDGAATVIAAYPNSEALVGQSLAANPAFNAIVHSPDGTVESGSFDHASRVISHARLPDTNATLVVMRPLDAVTANANRLARYATGKIVIAGLLSLLVIWIGGERLVVRPITSLSRAAIRLGSGDLDTRIPTEGLAPELRRLGESFNSMAAQLRARDADLRRANHRLTDLASKDALTGIANRRSFDAQLTAEWRRSRRDEDWLALLAIDVDHFKKFNDCFGHVEGDACLRRVATVLEDAARRAGDFAARTGGEEFVLLLPGTELRDAMAIAEGLRQKIEALEIAHPQSPEARVTISVGVAAICPDRLVKMSNLVDLADAALYCAKRTGRNRVVCDGQAVALAS